MKKEFKNIGAQKIVTILFLLLVITFSWSQVFKNMGNINSTGQKAQTYSAVTTPITPDLYYTFDNSTLASIGSTSSAIFGGSAASATSLSSSYKKSGGAVGNYMSFPLVASGGTPNPSLGSLAGVTNKMTIQFLFSPGNASERSTFISSQDVNIRFTQPKVDMSESTSTSYIRFGLKGDNLDIPLDGINRKSVSYYYTQPRLMTFVYDNGNRYVYVDGALLASKSGAISLSSNQNFTLGSDSGVSSTYFKLLDELLISKNVLPPNLILQNTQDVAAGAHYSYVTNITSVPNAPSYVGTLKTAEYLPGAILDYSAAHSEVDTAYTSTPPGMLTQLLTFPAPRVNKTSATPLLRNFLWGGLETLYSDTKGAYLSESALVTKGIPISKELYNNWNFRFPLGANPGADGDNIAWGSSSNGGDFYEYTMAGLDYLNTLQNSGKTVYASMTTNVNNVRPPSAKLANIKSGVGNSACLQNSSGTLINFWGGTTVPNPLTINCQWRPSATTTLFQSDGSYWRAGFTLIKNKVTTDVGNTNKFDLMVNDDDETLNAAKTSALQMDNAVKTAAMAAYPGLPLDTQLSRYQGARYAAIWNQYQAQLDPGFANLKFSVYWHGGGGNDDSSGDPYTNWNTSRTMQFAVNGNRYGAKDLYYRYQYQWLHNMQADHSVVFAEYNQYYQNKAGDKFDGSFTSAGWSPNISWKVQPSGLLGTSKIFAGLGSEFFYPGNYMTMKTDTWMQGEVYSYVMPAYAQAIDTKFDSFYKNSTLMQNDVLHLIFDSWGAGDYGYPMAYRLPTNRQGDTYTIARKSNTANKYMIYTTTQAPNNLQEAVPDINSVTTKIDGTEITFDSRVQGSVYMFDNTNPSSPIFYQLDGWHERAHPYNWSKSFQSEAEMYDSGTPTIYTEGPGVTSKNFSGNNYTTYTTGASSYVFQARNGTTTTNASFPTFMVRGRSGNGSSAAASFKVDGGSSFSVSTTNQSFCWMKLDAVASLQNITPGVDHTLSYLGTDSNFKFDQFVLVAPGSSTSGYTLCGNTNPVDSIAPTAPTNITSANITSTSVTLNWSQSTDAVGVSGYKIYKNGTLSSTVSGTTYDIIGLTASTTYSFEISSFDAAGNESSKTAKSVTTLATGQTSCTGSPDLVVLDFKTNPVNPVAGDTVTFQAQVKNLGCATPTGTISGNPVAALNGTPYKTGVLFTPTLNGTALSQYFYSDNYTASIAKDETVWITANTGSAGSASWVAVAGNYDVAVKADDINRISELIESNNQYNGSFIVSPVVSSGIAMSGITSGATFAKGSDINMSATITGSQANIKTVKFYAQKMSITGSKEIVRCSDVTVPFASCTWASAGPILMTKAIPFDVWAVAYNASDIEIMRSSKVNIVINP